MKRKIIIIGSGPAGYTAAIYCARANLSPLIISGKEPGGQLMITTEVENYPGYRNPILGPALMEEMLQQSIAMGTEIIEDFITAVDFSTTPFALTGSKKSSSKENQQYSADAVIIATGAQAKSLGLESEKKYLGYGVSMCATCDGPFFRKKHVVVVGGGNTALEEAIFLSNLAEKVTIIHRRDKFRGEKILQDRVMSKKNIEIIWNSEILEIIGEENPHKHVIGAILKNTTNCTEKNTQKIDCDGIFIAIGHKPSTEIFQDKLALDQDGYILLSENHNASSFSSQYKTMTSVNGIFAAGDVSDKIYRQAVTAAGMGCMAALDAEKFLEALH